MFEACYLLAREIFRSLNCTLLPREKGAWMSVAKEESFGFLPWIAILVTVIVILIVYICAVNV
jgi:hypothetical protein